MDNLPTGELIEMFGIAVAVVNKDLKIEDLSVYYDPNPVLTKLTGKRCPVANKTRQK